MGGVSVLVEALLLSPGFRPPREALLWSSGCHPPRESGSASMMPRSPANCYLGFRPPSKAGAADVAALASKVLLEVSSPKRSWGGVNDAALASGCRTAVARRWVIRLIAADNAGRPMKAADAAPGL